MSAKERALAQEKALYDALLDTLLTHLTQLQQTATAIATLDVVATLAHQSITLSLTRPSLTGDDHLEITKGRHLVIEQVQSTPFMPNDLMLNEKTRMQIITGPNMGGKSTYMRQTALIVLLAHIGSFVPASAAKIGKIDRIFSRIGASDDLASNRSTFMVEMTETANILHNATRHSLVLMDEIGRGTSTFDGLSLAFASAKALAEKIQAFTLFATHYFELTTLSDEHKNVENVHFSADEKGDDLVFLHTLAKGAANKSYGIQVAKLAGLPSYVIQAAKNKLHTLETSVDSQRLPPPKVLPEKTAPSPALALLDKITPDTLSPREAHTLIYELKALTHDS